MKWLLLLWSVNALALTPDRLPALKDCLSVPPYSSMANDSAFQLYTKVVDHVIPYYLTDRDLYEELGPDLAEEFLNVLRSWSVDPKLTGTYIAMACKKLIGWIESGRGIDIGEPALRAWLVKMGGLAPAVKPSFDRVLALAVRHTSPLQDDFGDGATLTLAELITARGLP